MPIDDLDRLLEMELGAAPERRSIAEQVSSLEAQVLNRVQQTRSPEDSPLPNSVPLFESISEPKSTDRDKLDPIYQYAEALLPIINAVDDLLKGESENRTEAALLRTQLAERLLSLPDLKAIDKAGIFAAMAMCIDAVGSLEPESRRAARERLEKLMRGLETAKLYADHKRFQAIDQFLYSLNREDY